MQYQDKNKDASKLTARAAQAFLQLRRSVGERIKPGTFLTDGVRTETAAAWLDRLCVELGTPEAAGQRLAAGLVAFTVQVAPAPPRSQDRKTRIAEALANRQPRKNVKSEILGVMDDLRAGKRIVSVAKGIEKAAPVRDPRTGKIDVMATARKYGMVAEAQGSEDQQSARFDLQDLTSRALFGDLGKVMA